MSWNGGVTLDGTGFAYSGGGEKLRRDVSALRSRGVHVLASVGGGAAGDWFNNVQTERISRFVEVFGLSGVDIDYEPPNAWDRSDAGNKLVSLARQFRARLPEGKYLLTSATWMNGVDTGNMIPVLQSDLLDAVFIMSYDAGTVPNYADILAKHRRGNHVLTVDEVRSVANTAKADPASGVFLWHLSKSDGSLSAQRVIEELASIL